MIGSLVAGMLLLRAQDAPRDVKLPVMPIWQLAEWLEGQTGIDTIVLPQVQDKLIYINVKQRTLKELYGLVEQATGVEVLDQNGVLTLRPSPRVRPAPSMTVAGLQKNIDEISGADATEEILRKAIPEYMEMSERLSKTGFRFDTPDGQRMQELARLDLSRAAMGRFLRAVGARALSELPEHERVVFSTEPTRFQRAWPTSATAEMKRATEAQALRNRLVDELVPPPDENNPQYYYYGGAITMRKGGAEAPVAGMTVALKKMPYAVEVHLRMFDKDGNVTDETTEHMQGAEMGEFSEAQKKITESLKDLKGEYKLTEAEKREVERVSALFGGMNQTVTATREDMEWLAQVDTVEPFSGVVTRVLDFGAEQLDCEAVTEVFMPLQQMRDMGTVSANDAVLTLCMQSFTKMLEPKRGSLLVGSPLPDWIYQYVVSRRSMAAMARTVLERGKLTFDDLSDGVLNLTSSDQMMMFIPASLNLAGQSTGSEYFEPRGWKTFLMTAYANLSPNERRAVFSEEGLEIDIASTRPAIRDAFWQSARATDNRFGGEFMIGPDGRPYSPPGPDELVITEWNKEPTVFWAHPKSVPIKVKLTGLTNDGLMILQSHTQPDGTSFEMKSFSGVEDLARMQTWMEISPPQGNYVPPKVLGMSVANRLEISMAVSFGAFKLNTEQFSMLTEPVGKLGSEAELPQAIRDRLEKTRNQVREDYRKSQQRVPPPHH